MCNSSKMTLTLEVTKSGLQGQQNSFPRWPPPSQEPSGEEFIGNNWQNWGLSQNPYLHAWIFDSYPPVSTVTPQDKAFEPLLTHLFHPSCSLPLRVLGEHDQEPPVCLRHPQEQHHRRLPLRSGSDVHGLLFNLRTPSGQRLPFQQASLCQGYPQLQELGGKVSFSSRNMNGISKW